MPTSPFIYLNAALPVEYAPPLIAEHRHLATQDLQQLLTSNDVAITPLSTGTAEERLVRIFEHSEVLFGDPGFIPTHRADWLDRFARFTAANQPVQFVAMAFPYKSPNPLKTDRRGPDLGEALMLRRFQAVLDAVAAIYPPGGVLTILEEGILGRCQGVEPRRIVSYRDGIAPITVLSGVDPTQIQFHSLDDMVDRIPNFEARWIQEEERMRELWEAGDPDVRAAHTTTMAAQRTSVPTLDFDPNVLARAYDPSQTTSELRYIRDYLDKVSHRQFFAYRSLLNLRDAGYLGEIAPGAIKLTVSPKPENLSVVPVNRQSRILPYHGVPVRHLDGGWDIRYLAAMAEFGAVRALHLTGDADPAPIGYQVIE